jgi:hypothetical protein
MNDDIEDDDDTPQAQLPRVTTAAIVADKICTRLLDTVEKNGFLCCNNNNVQEQRWIQRGTIIVKNEKKDNTPKSVPGSPVNGSNSKRVVQHQQNICSIPKSLVRYRVPLETMIR